MALGSCLMSTRWPNRGAGAFTDEGRKVVLLTEREATAVLERLQAVMTRTEQGGESDLGRAVRVLERQCGWLAPQAERVQGRCRVSMEVAS